LDEPPLYFLAQGIYVRKVLTILKPGESVCSNNLVELSLRLALYVGIKDHGEHKPRQSDGSLEELSQWGIGDGTRGTRTYSIRACAERSSPSISYGMLFLLPIRVMHVTHTF
jgi:hypothetical protein